MTPGRDLLSYRPVVVRPFFWEGRPRFRPVSTVGHQDSRTKGRAPPSEGAWDRECPRSVPFVGRSGARG